MTFDLNYIVLLFDNSHMGFIRSSGQDMIEKLINNQPYTTDDVLASTFNGAEILQIHGYHNEAVEHLFLSIEK